MNMSLQEIIDRKGTKDYDVNTGRKETEDYDCDDYDPNGEQKTKKELDLDLLLYRIKDPRLSEKERRDIADQISALV